MVPGAPARLTEVEVVRRRIVEIHRLFHQREAQKISVERQGPGGVGGNHGDVVESQSDHLVIGLSVC